MSGRSKEVWGWIRYMAAAAAAVFLITQSAGLSRVSGQSMLPSLEDRDILLVNKLSRYLDEPSCGDVAIIASSTLGYRLIKRVIGVPGNVVEIRDGIVYVDSQALPELYAVGMPEDMEAQRVKPGHVFVLGDNRDPGASLDSRNPKLGQVPSGEIEGYALLRLLPWGGIAGPLD
ncbi:signal peptidase I [Paenibacillus albicereus]|uniref:Signal peptidase I n=1 Tax=Paenibacillus albicereus TaxID=2726185 RepID=A0A6H2H2Y6_9BACL|nr:signal peptidase I [Paenibacillus albicereus]QJC53995.1 signal peptidase I [Paenibacillus albicereus]